ncbi:MAG TPA: protein kinase [Gemmatimonadaceae bacterium]|nr:protein kinase [Gemmatimonadaceae bacterium]
MSELRERLQSTLGTAYTLDRELGGGGMSRVFVADETALGRKVVVKVLPPELAAGVSVERFNREIQVAARLQHPHIVPVLSAGETQGLPFYTMPFVEGSSLRARLGQGPLSITETVGVLREVARALAYAHEHGVVHRDIKPDNVLLTGGSAVVTDFGIAKALSASRLEGPAAPTLTALGTSLGTPAYMAPEQSAGDPSTNHRADLYAFGCMAYELLAGRPPFHGRSPHKLMAAHMGERPQPIGELRPDTPPALAELVMRCLEKEPDHRPQSAADLARVLETVTSSGPEPAMPQVLLGGRGMLKRALALYAAAFVTVAVLARAAIVGIGLPDWVFPGALLVMALGLPVILFTAYVQRAARRAYTVTPSLTPGGSPSPQGTMATIALKAAPMVSWRRTAMGGVIAVGTFIALIGAWMLLRSMGIGPAGSLMAAGKLGERERVILTEFQGPATDTLLAATVTEAFRTDLAQSENLNVMPASSVREALQRMQRPANTRLDFNLAREIATREGIKAVIDASILTLGGRYTLSARLIATQSGEPLATVSETADDSSQIIPAISRLSKKLRERTGESLRAIQNARSLERVTTPSLAALQKYVAAVRALEEDGDWERGHALLQESIGLDSTFAMAWRKLAVERSNRFFPRDQVQLAIQKAYDHRERLSESERYLTIAGYFQWGPTPDRNRIVSAYESLLEIDPLNVAALNNLAVQYRYRRQYPRAEELAERAIGQQSASVFYNNALWSEIAQGKLDEAKRTVDAFAAALPRNPNAALGAAFLAGVEGDLERAATITDSLRRARVSEPVVTQNTDWYLGVLAQTRGKLGDALRWFASGNDAALRLGNADAALHTMLDSADFEIWFRGDKDRARAHLQRALATHPLESLPPAARPHDRLVWLYSLLGQATQAREAVAAFDRRHEQEPALDDGRRRRMLAGHVALAEGRYDEALAQYRAGDEGGCSVCVFADLARVHDLAGNADSVIANFERFLAGPTEPIGWLSMGGMVRAGAHKRLGELYEARGDRAKAMSHYARFVELWKDADPELQPLVRQARDRLTALQRAER